MGFLASSYTPKDILAIQHSPTSKGFDELFELMDNIVVPSNIKKKYITEEKQELRNLTKT